MSYEILIVVFQTPAIRMEARRNYQNCSIFPVMVSTPRLWCQSLCGNILSNRYTELSIAPEKNSRLVPPHMRQELRMRGIDLDNFVPLTKEEMMARLD